MFQVFEYEVINIRNRGTMIVTNQERVREFRGNVVHVFGGGRLSAVYLQIQATSMTIDALATVEATLKGQTFAHAGSFLFNRTLVLRVLPGSILFYCFNLM